MRDSERRKLIAKIAGMSAILSFVVTLNAVMPALAGLPASSLSSISVRPAPNASLPLGLSLREGDEDPKDIRNWLAGRPSVWILADFTCQSLCSPVLRQTADALNGSGLVAGRDFNLFVAGIDPKDTAQDAAAMKAAQIGTEGPLTSHTSMLRGDEKAVAELSERLGFHAVYDKANDQFAHPAAIFIVAADGRVSRMLSGLGLDPQELRLALVEAGKGQVGTLADHVRLLCYGFDPARGTYNFLIGRALTIGAGITMAALALLLGLMLRKERSGHGPLHPRA
jgi:protein SCO1/2